MLECLVLPSVVTWTAVGSDGVTPAPGDWSNFQNWTDDRGMHRLPGPGDDVFINAPAVKVDHYTGIDTIRSLHIVGELMIDGGTLVVTDGIHLQEAVLSLGPTATLAISGTQNLDGSGSVLFSSDHPGSEIQLTKDTTWTVGSGITVDGNTGAIGPAQGVGDAFSVLNEGELGSNVAGGALQLTGGSWTNQGIIEALGGGATELDRATLTNISGSSLTGGTWKVAGNKSALELGIPPVTVNDATIILDGADAALIGMDETSNLLAGLTSNQGSLTLRDGAALTNGAALSNSGHLDIETDSVLNVGGIYSQTNGTTIINGLLTSTAFTMNIDGGTLQGDGTVDAVIYPPSAAPPSLHHEAVHATVTLSNLTQTYDGSPEPVTVTTEPAGLDVNVTYNGSSTPPTHAGTYAVSATIVDDNYTGTATGALVIGKATPTVVVTPLNVTYDGNPHGTTGEAFGVGGSDLGPADIGYSSIAVPTDAGNYVATASFSGSADYTTATGTGTITIAKATPTVTVTPVVVNAFDGKPHGTTGVVTGVDGVSLGSPFITYNTTTGLAPVDPGTYTATGTFAGNANYTSATGTATISISKALPTLIKVVPVSAVFDGTAHGTTGEVFGVDGVDLGPATITYSSGSAPVNAGDYTATATFAGNVDYAGASATTTISIARATPTIEVAPFTVTYDGQPHGTTAAVFGVDHVDLGPAVIAYSSGTAPVDAGTYTVTGAFEGNADYASTSSAGLITITPTAAAVSLGDLNQIYNGQPETVTASTDPPGLPVIVTYNGSTTPPALPGAYAVTATVTDHNYAGSASGTLTISGAAVITSAAATSVTEGKDGSFVVTTSGFPLPVLTETGTLPAGVTFTDNHDGTATFSGIPAEDTEGTYLLNISATNAVGASASQTLVLNVLTPDQSGNLLASITVLTQNGKAQAAIPATDNGHASVNLAVPDNIVAALWLASFLGNPAQQQPTLSAAPIITTAVTPTGASTVEVAVEQDLVYLDTRVNGVDNVDSAIATAIFTFPGTAISAAGLSDFAIKFWNGTTWQDLLSSGPGGQPPFKPIPQPGIDANGKAIWTITVVFDANSTPSIKHLKGTVFTLALPTTMTTATVVISPPQVFISTRASTDTGNGLATAATFASTGQVNLILRVSNETEFVASRTAVSGGLEGDITILPDTDDGLSWLRDVPWIWDMIRPGSSPPPARPRRGAAAPPAQPGAGASGAKTGLPAPADDSDVIAIDSFFTDPEPAAPEQLGPDLLLFDRADPDLSMLPHASPSASWGFPLAACAVAVSTRREKPVGRSRRYRPALEGRR